MASLRRLFQSAMETERVYRFPDFVKMKVAAMQWPAGEKMASGESWAIFPRRATVRSSSAGEGEGEMVFVAAISVFFLRAMCFSLSLSLDISAYRSYHVQGLRVGVLLAFGCEAVEPYHRFRLTAMAN